MGVADRRGEQLVGARDRSAMAGSDGAANWPARCGRRCWGLLPNPLPLDALGVEAGSGDGCGLAFFKRLCRAVMKTLVALVS